MPDEARCYAGMLESIGLASAGRAGSRLAQSLGLTASRDTLLRLVRALPDPPVGIVTILGVDDFAIKRGQTYATILLNMSTRRPIDVLPDREADTLAEWLKAHPEVTVITRDRAGNYAEGATRGAPQATQCADRFHLWQNLGEAVTKTVIAHRACLRTRDRCRSHGRQRASASLWRRGQSSHRRGHGAQRHAAGRA